MTRFVIVPGIDGSDETHWQTAWEHELGTDAVRIQPSSWEVPELDDWIQAIDAACQDAEPEETVIVVAHSLGCWAATEWISRQARIGVGLFLVAPPDPQGPVFPRDAAPTFTELRARPLGVPAVVIASDDDPYCALETAASFAHDWSTDLTTVEGHGHLNSASALGSWPEGQAMLARFMAESLHG
jgi:serine hydrolase